METGFTTMRGDARLRIAINSIGWLEITNWRVGTKSNMYLLIWVKFRFMDFEYYSKVKMSQWAQCIDVQYCE